MMMRDGKAVKKEMKEDNKKEKKQSKKEKKAKEAEARNWLETALAEAEEAEYALEAAARTRVEPRHAGQNGSMSSEILRIHRRLRGKQYVDPRNQSMSFRGWTLVPADNKAGYKGVSQNGKKRWSAYFGRKPLGQADSPEQAALLYARHIGKEESAKQAQLVAERSTRVSFSQDQSATAQVT